MKTKEDQSVSDIMAAYFCRMAETVGLPRSVALIYHALFVSRESLTFGEIVERTTLSKASASTGLKMLERMRGIERVMVTDDRRTFFRAQLSLRRILSGLLKENLLPGLEDGQRLLDDAREEAGKLLDETLHDRLTSLRRWHEHTSAILPAIMALDEKS